MGLEELGRTNPPYENIPDSLKVLYDKLVHFEPVKNEHVEIIGFNLPFKEYGGDYINVIHKKDDSFLVLMGDVMGKGVQASFMTAMIHGALRGITMRESEPHQILHDLNETLVKDFQRFNAFATFLVSHYNEKTRMLRWSNAGHYHPILWKNSTKKCQFIIQKGVMVGVVEPLHYETQNVQLDKGDLILWYSDGLIELYNEKERYSVTRLIRCLENYSDDNSLTHIVECIKEDVRQFGEDGRIHDDISFIAMKTM
jgi:sigma-B regulation protein RsbU (phosphoserine phosphatase)